MTCIHFLNSIDTSTKSQPLSDNNYSKLHRQTSQDTCRPVRVDEHAGHFQNQSVWRLIIRFFQWIRQQFQARWFLYHLQSTSQWHYPMVLVSSTEYITVTLSDGSCIITVTLSDGSCIIYRVHHSDIIRWFLYHLQSTSQWHYPMILVSSTEYITVTLSCLDR